MNKTVIFSQLSATVAGLTRSDEADAAEFLRVLFQLTAEQLEAEGEAVIPGIGRFVVTSETIAFAPDAELAAAVNAPFAAFEPVELDSEYDEEVAEPEAIDEAVATDAILAEGECCNACEQAAANEVAAGAEFERTLESTVDPTPRANDEETEEHSAAHVAEEHEPPHYAEPEPDRSGGQYRSWPWWTVACIICFATGYLTASLMPASERHSQPVPDVVEQEIAGPDSTNSDPEVRELAEQPVAPTVNKEPVTDTIKPGRFLTTMAREHYGCMEYWVYIYEANAARLGHPDRLSAGTVVTVPDADSLGLDPANEAKIQEAKRKAESIYSRFN